MTKSRLGDLNDHLFAEIERLGDEELKGEKLEAEIERSKAIADIAKNIISNADLVFRAQKHVDEFGKDRSGVAAALQLGNTDMSKK